MSPRMRSLALLLFAIALLSAAAWQARGTVATEKDKTAESPRPSGPRYWKGNLHTHSFWSDGDDFPEMIVDWYHRHGYQFLTLSDHNILSEGDKWVDIIAGREPALKKYAARFGPSWIERREEKGKQQVRLKPLREFRSVFEEPGKFLLIQGEEITHRFAKLPIHMNGINLRDVVIPINGDNVSETIKVNHRAVEQQREKTKWPGVTFLNHPNFGWGVTAEEMAAVDELRFFEVFNGHPSVRNYGDKARPGTEKMWDIALTLRLTKYRTPALYGVATDDAHSYHSMGLGKSNPGRSWVMVRAAHLTAESIVRAMNAGDFYASSGVILDDVRRDGKELSLKIRAESGVKYRTQFIVTKRGVDPTPKPAKDAKDAKVYSPDLGAVVAETDGLEPAYRLTGQELYVRAKVISTKPHPNPYEKGDVEVAWTQPLVP
jgi:hypothetical protein